MLRRVLLVLWRLLLTTTWLLVILAVGLLGLEESGVMADFLHESVAWRLGPLGDGLDIKRVRLRWFEPGIVLEEVRLHAPGDGKHRKGVELLRLKSVHFSLHPDFDSSSALRRLHIRGGRVLISDRLFEGLDRLAASFRDDEGSLPDVRRSLTPPPFYVSDFRVEVELPDAAPFELGRVDLFARPDEDGGFEMTGRMFPTLAGAVPDPVAIHVDGRQWRGGVEIHASARDLPLQTESFRVPSILGTLPVESFSGLLTLDSSLRIELGEEARTEGSLRAALHAARLQPSPDDPWVENVRLDLETFFHPEAGKVALWNRDSWTATARIGGDWNDTPLEAWGQFGTEVRRDAWARVFARASRLPLEESTLEALRFEELLREEWEAFAPSGHVDTSVELFLWPPVLEETWRTEVAFHTRATGDAGSTFVGFKDPIAPGSTDTEYHGFPLPTTDLRADVVFSYAERLARPWRVAAIDISANHGSGTISGWSQTSAPPPWSTDPRPEFDLVLGTESMKVDEKLEAALMANPGTREVWPTYRPEGGTVSGSWRLRQGPETDGLTGEGHVQVEGTTLTWAELPIPIRNARGALSFHWAESPTTISDIHGYRERHFGLTYELDNQGTTEPGPKARVRGWTRQEPTAAVVRKEEIPETWIQEVDVHVEELFLRGTDFDVLAGVFPELGEQVAEFNARGRVQLNYYGTQAHPDHLFRSDIEAIPSLVEVTPRVFPRRTRDLKGRVLFQSLTRLDSEEAGLTEARFLLSGRWPGGVELCAFGTLPPVGDADIEILGVGVDANNLAFKGALLRSLAVAEEDSGEESGDIDLSDQHLYGPIDFTARARFDPQSEAPAENSFRIFLRDNVLENDSVRLQGLAGVLTQKADILTSPLVYANLAGHPVEMRNVLVFPLSEAAELPGADPLLLREGFWSDPRGHAVQADLYTKDLPLDVEHLESLLDAEGLAALQENQVWEGLIDIQGASLIVTNEKDESGKVALHGPLRPHDLRMSLGLPIAVSEADIDVDELVLEAGRFRGWGRIRGLSADIADRKLTDGSMILGYVDGRLTVEDLDGGFEGGRIKSFGKSGVGARKAVGVDLGEPNRFDIAIRLEDVRVDRLLKGVFQSSIADEGNLDLTLQLSGTPGEILGWTGRGILRLDDGRLWSIPVVRELFGQLGFDKTAVFDRLRSRFELRDGRVNASYLEVKSTLVNLVGDGWHDLDGRMSFDMELRYGLLDRLGYVSRFLYWLNNSLLRVAIRGDFERPRVTIRNSILEVFKGFNDTPRRALPVPDYSPLPQRF